MAMLAGCTGPTADGEPGSAAPASPDNSEAALRDAVAADEAGLIAAYDAALAAGDDPLLREFRAQHAEHLAALGVSAPTVMASPAPADASTGALAERERRAADERRRACGAASDPALARLLALIGASEAQHAAALGSA